MIAQRSLWLLALLFFLASCQLSFAVEGVPSDTTVLLADISWMHVGVNFALAFVSAISLRWAWLQHGGDRACGR